MESCGFCDKAWRKTEAMRSAKDAKAGRAKAPAEPPCGLQPAESVLAGSLRRAEADLNCRCGWEDFRKRCGGSAGAFALPSAWLRRERGATSETIRRYQQELGRWLTKLGSEEQEFTATAVRLSSSTWRLAHALAPLSLHFFMIFAAW